MCILQFFFWHYNFFLLQKSPGGGGEYKVWKTTLYILCMMRAGLSIFKHYHIILHVFRVKRLYLYEKVFTDVYELLYSISWKYILITLLLVYLYYSIIYEILECWEYMSLGYWTLIG